MPYKVNRLKVNCLRRKFTYSEKKPGEFWTLLARKKRSSSALYSPLNFPIQRGGNFNLGPQEL